MCDDTTIKYFFALSPNKGVTVCVKNCQICKTLVRFQEYTAGFHNFSNSIILTTSPDGGPP